MKQTLPRMTRIGVLVTLTAPSHRPALHALEAAAPKLGVQVLTVPVRTPEALDGAFAMMARERVNGFLAVASPLTRSQRALLAELALKHRLPGMFGTRENVDAGSLMSYAPDLVDMTRRGALDHERHGLSVGADAMACRPGRGAGRAESRGLLSKRGRGATLPSPSTGAPGLTQAGVLPQWHLAGVLRWRNSRPRRAGSALE